MKYGLIKEYPGSPEKGTIVESSGEEKYVNESKNINLFWHFVEHYPDYWKLVKEKILVVEDVEHLVNIEVFRWGVHGGQYVNKVDSAVRLTCDKLGFMVDCGYHRSVYQNKEVCLDALQAFLDKLPMSVKEYYKNKSNNKKISS